MPDLAQITSYVARFGSDPVPWVQKQIYLYLGTDWMQDL
jgi:hypothetical protein